MQRVTPPFSRRHIRNGFQTLAALAWLITFGAQFASATPRAGRFEDRLRPQLVAPAPGERLAENAIVFAIEPPRGTGDLRVILLPREFDPSQWREVPGNVPDLVVRSTKRGVVSFADLGITITKESTWWWTVGARDAQGAWHFAPVRSFVAIPKFSNRVAPSPYLVRGVLGQLAPDELKRERAETFASPEDARLSAVAIPGGASPHIRLAAGFDFTPATATPVLPTELSVSRLPEAMPGGGEMQAVLVQFKDAPGEAELRAVAEVGGAVFSYIPDQAYLVRLSPDARARLAAAASVAWIGDWQPAYKLSPSVDRSAAAPARFAALLFPDAEVAAVSQALTGMGAVIADVSSNGINKLIRFDARGDQVTAAAGLSSVAWIEPVLPLTIENDNAQWVVQTDVSNSRRIWDMGIHGEGQVVMTSDTGITTAHDQFRDSSVTISTWGDYPTHRKVIAYKMGSNNPSVEFGDDAPASYHGTHTAGTFIGSDDPVGNASPRDGMAKGGKIYFMDISGTALGNSVDPFPDLNDLFLPSYLGNAGGAARLSSNSWGSTSNGAYTLNSLQVDQFMWNHPDYFISFSNGNSGPTGGTVGSPASAKDCIGMGGVRNGPNQNQIYNGTSRGPTLDGRRKPTVCAPGQSVFSANGATTNGYISLTGTSMASPSGTGAIALIRQYLTEGWYPTGAKTAGNGFNPSAALLKAMAINSADNGVMGFTAPDNNIGWGRIDVDNVLYFPGDQRKLLLEDFTSGLQSGQYVEYQVAVVDTTQPLKVSLCWTDYPGSPSAAVQLVNNLDLTVSQGATVYKGNSFAVSGYSAQGGVADNRNVEEGVSVATPTKGVWTVRVAAPSVPMGPQPFGLVITGGVGNGAGTLAMDRSSYGSSSTMQLQVVDTDVIPPVTVNVSSSTEPGGETVTLTGASGVYTGSINLAPTLPVAADGVLSVSNGDGLTANYSDATTSAIMVAHASVDFSTPVITNVHAASLGPVGNLITWDTDRNSTSRVIYGTTTALELGNVDSIGYATHHQVLVSGVSAGQTYYYDVQSVSLSGSSARDDRGGGHYRFTAKAPGDVLLMLGDAGFERLITWQSSLNDDSYDYDIWSGSLADNPALGDQNSGLRSYKAVIFQCGIDDYPPVSDTQASAFDSYLSGGGRLWILGHDLGWGLADPSSPSYSAARAAWLQNTLHANFLADPATWATENGVLNDPISGPFVSPNGVAYSPFGSGQAGDEVSINAGTGTGNYVWMDTDASPDNNVLRWESNMANGTPGTGTWAGLPSRLVSEFLEFTAMRPPFASPDAIRDTILDRTLTWLFARQRPQVTLASPNGGESITTPTTNITWTESVGGGFSVANRTIEYSTDGGDSWSTVATGVGASPYVWNLSGVPNTTHARVRVRISDDGSPSFRASDPSAADFTINRGGGDVEGPAVVPGSIAVNPNPVVRGTSAALTATVSDANTGGGVVDAAEWSFGPTPAAAGSGTPMNGVYGATSVAVSLVLNTQYFVLGPQKLWVRGHDAAGNWGAASSLDVQVNGTGTSGVGEVPAVSFLSQNAPNPAGAGTTIRFGLARSGAIALDIFDAQGRRVRRLASGSFAAGLHQASWDGRNDAGSRVGAGIYFYRLSTPEKNFEKRLALLP